MRGLRYPLLILEQLGFPLALTQTLQVLASSCLPQQIFNFGIWLRHMKAENTVWDFRACLIEDNKFRMGVQFNRLIYMYGTRLGSFTCHARDKENALVRARDFHVIYLYMVMSRFWYMHRYPSPRRRRTFSGISPLSLAARISWGSLESHSSASGHGLTLGML